MEKPAECRIAAVRTEYDIIFHGIEILKPGTQIPVHSGRTYLRLPGS